MEEMWKAMTIQTQTADDDHELYPLVHLSQSWQWL